MPSPRVVILLPPSEHKATGGRRPPWSPELGHFRALGPDREHLQALMSQPGALSALKPAAAARTMAAAVGPTRPALDRYTGVLYDALGVGSMSPSLRRAAGTRLIIVSGYAGLLLGRDPVPDYSLPIGTVVGGAGGLAGWWRPRLTPLLDEATRGAVVWDLLPGAHSSVWAAAGTWRSRWCVRVLQEDAAGRRTTVSHHNKATKGALARHLLETSPRHPRDLADWRGPGGAEVELGPVASGSGGGVVEVVARAR